MKLMHIDKAASHFLALKTAAAAFGLNENEQLDRANKATKELTGYDFQALLEVERFVTDSSSLFDQFNIGGDYRDELLELLEPHGGKEFYDIKSEDLGCPAIVFIADKGVYSTWPDGCEYHETIEDFLEHHELTKNELAEDLGIDVSELAHPLEFSVDIRSASQDIYKTMEKHGGVVGAMKHHAKELDRTLNSDQAGAYIHIEALNELLEHGRLTGQP